MLPLTTSSSGPGQGSVPLRPEPHSNARPSISESKEEDTPMAAVKGILGRKLGMTQVWDSDNRVIPVTVIQGGPCRVVQLKTPERDGYSAVQIAFGETKPARLNKPELGHLKKGGVRASKHLVELRVDD